VFPSASVLPASQTVVKLAAVADAEGSRERAGDRTDSTTVETR